MRYKNSKLAIHTTKIAQCLLHSVLLHRRQVTHRTERVTHFQLSSGRHMHAWRAYYAFTWPLIYFSYKFMFIFRRPSQVWSLNCWDNCIAVGCSNGDVEVLCSTARLRHYCKPVQFWGGGGGGGGGTLLLENNYVI